VGSLLNGPQVLATQGAITNIYNHKDSGSHSLDWTVQTVSNGFRIGRSYSPQLRVITNSPLVGPVQIQQALLGIGIVHGNYYSWPFGEINPVNTELLPGPFPYEIDTGSYVQSINMARDGDDGKQWTVTVNYGPFDLNHDAGSSEVSNGSLNPAEMAPQVEWGTAKYEVSFPLDINGNPYLNTAGDPLENPPKQEESRLTLDFVRNELTYNPAYANSYADTINTDSFLGYQQYQVKCKSITGKRIYSADYGFYWEVHYAFEFRNKTFPNFNAQGNTQTFGFQELVLNAGLRQLDLSQNPPALKQILINGSPITSPVALAQNGTILNNTWYQTTGENPTPYYLTFTNFPQSTFANLNIPQDILTTNQ
jgi:hypothetical protein